MTVMEQRKFPRNILRTLATAKEKGLHTIGLTGKTGGKIRNPGDLDCCICAPTDETSRISAVPHSDRSGDL